MTHEQSIYCLFRSNEWKYHEIRVSNYNLNVRFCQSCDLQISPLTLTLWNASHYTSKQSQLVTVRIIISRKRSYLSTIIIFVYIFTRPLTLRFVVGEKKREGKRGTEKRVSNISLLRSIPT